MSDNMRLVDYFVQVTMLSDGTRQLVKRIPAIDHMDFELPHGIPYFCIPGDTGIVYRDVYERSPIFFTFSLTGGDGSRAFGTALLYYEEITQPDALNRLKWRPQVLCLISHSPFVPLFKSVLSWLYRSRDFEITRLSADAKIERECWRTKWLVSPRPQSKLKRRTARSSSSPDLLALEDNNPASDIERRQRRIDRIISDFILTTTVPSPGSEIQLTLQLSADSHETLSYRVRQNNRQADDYCFRVLFQCLRPSHVIRLINCLLAEQRVLIHSMHYGLLTAVCDALLDLLHPFSWEHVYIPVLPIHLIDYLQAPVPYIMGIHTSALSTRTGSDVYASCVVVHLDKDQLIAPIESQLDNTLTDETLTEFPRKSNEILMENVLQHLPTSLSHSENRKIKRRARRNAVASPTPALSSEVELTFGPGPLGITFESTHLRLLAAGNFGNNNATTTDASAVIKSFPKLRNGVPGPAELSGCISPGSYLIAINGESTLQLSFEETIARLRNEIRPMRLRFQNASFPHENARIFATKLKPVSMLSIFDEEGIQNTVASSDWIDKLRNAFSTFYLDLLGDYQSFIHVQDQPQDDRRSSFEREHSIAVNFDTKGYLSAVPMESRSFLAELIETQAFHGLMNETALKRIKPETTIDEKSTIMRWKLPLQANSPVRDKPRTSPVKPSRQVHNETALKIECSVANGSHLLRQVKSEAGLLKRSKLKIDLDQ